LGEPLLAHLLREVDSGPVVPVVQEEFLAGKLALALEESSLAH
jgi:hypothetical protein